MKSIKIDKKINTKGMNLSVYLSMEDLSLFEKANKKKLSFKNAIILSILNKTTNVKKSDINDIIIEQYITIVLKSNKELNAYYRSLIIDDDYERFVKACLEYQKIKYNNLSENIKHLSQKYEPNIINIAKQINSVINNSGIAKLREQYIDNITQLMTPLINVLKKYSEEVVFDSIVRIKKSLSQIYDTVDFEGLSKKDKKTYKSQYESWGKHGWTIIPGFEDYYMNSSYINNKLSDTKILSFINNNRVIDYVFEKLKQTNIRKSDLVKAFEMFEIKEYKLCAMMIFSLIENVMIKNQTSKMTDKKARRVGEKASKLYKNFYSLKIDSLPANEFLFFYNIIVALETFFSNTGGFIKQTDVINRNMLMHGMMYKRVTKKDCIQLFVILYNLDFLLKLLKK